MDVLHPNSPTYPVVWSSAVSEFESQALSHDHPWQSTGRFSRLSFLGWSLIWFLLFLPLAALVIGVSEGAYSLSHLMTEPTPLKVSTWLWLSPLLLALLYGIGIAGIRRLHDLGHSGYAVILVFIPIINIPVGLYLILARGWDGFNAYGPQRPTLQWEAVMGWICLLMKITQLAMLGATSYPLWLNHLV